MSLPAEKAIKELQLTILSSSSGSSIAGPAVKESPVKIELSFSLAPKEHPSASLDEYEASVLMSIFPGTIAVSLTTLGVVIRMKELPAFPHPVMVANVPLYLTTDINEVTGWNNWGVMSTGAGAPALQQFDFKNLTTLNVSACDKIAKFCVEREIPLKAVRLIFSPAFVCVLHSTHDKFQLPMKIGGMLCFWTVEEPSLQSFATHAETISIEELEETDIILYAQHGDIVLTNDEIHGVAAGVRLAVQMNLIADRKGLEDSMKWRRAYWMYFSYRDGRDPIDGIRGTSVHLNDIDTAAGVLRYHDNAHHLSYVVAANQNDV